MARLIRTAQWNGETAHALVNNLMATQGLSEMANGGAVPERALPEVSPEELTVRRVAARARSQEQRRVSRLLHDEIGQCLTALNVQLAVLRARSRGAVQEQLKSAQGLLEKALGQVQRLSQDLYPSAVEDLGLVPALRAHIQHFSQNAALAVYFNADEDVQPSDFELRLAIFRSVQALLSDLESAAAAQARLSLEIGADGLLLEARARISRRKGSGPDLVPDVSSFHQQVLLAGGSVNYRAHRNQAFIAARFPMTIAATV
jgi:signal transduction histidine kinase